MSHPTDNTYDVNFDVLGEISNSVGSNRLTDGKKKPTSGKDVDCGISLVAALKDPLITDSAIHSIKGYQDKSSFQIYNDRESYNQRCSEILSLVSILIKGFLHWSSDKGMIGMEWPKEGEGVLKSLIHELEPNYILGGVKYAGHIKTMPMLPAVIAGLIADMFGINMLVPEQSGVARKIENQVIVDLCHMMGFNNRSGGRLAAGGTVCNIEALFIALRVASFPFETRKLAEEFDLDPFSELSPSHTLQYTKNLVNALKRKYGSSALGHLRNHVEQVQIKVPQFAVLVGRNAHFSVTKSLNIFGKQQVCCVPIEVNQEFEMDMNDLRRKLQHLKSIHMPVAAVVSTAGSTATGSVDPLVDVSELQEEYKFWWHIDAAYGGYMRSLLYDEGTGPTPLWTGVSDYLPAQTVESLRYTGNATSVVVDPHKLGFLPTGCGAILLSDADYTAFINQGCGYFQDETEAQRLRLREDQCFSSGVEGSRSGRAPLACHVMNQLYPLHAKGIGRFLVPNLIKTRDIWKRLCNMPQYCGLRLFPLHKPMTNIFCLVLGRIGGDLQETNTLTERFAHEIRNRGDLYCTLNIFFREDNHILFSRTLAQLGFVDSHNSDRLSSLRFVLSNPQAFENGIDEFITTTRSIIEEFDLSIRPERIEE